MNQGADMLRIVLLCGLLAPGAGPAQGQTPIETAAEDALQAPEASAQERARWQELKARQREQALEWATDADARHKLAAALLYPWVSADGDAAEEASDSAHAFAPSPEADAWLQDAAALAPDDALIAWAQATCSIETGRCDRAAGRDRLLRLDPGNAAVHLLAMNAATDAGAARTHLADAARASRYDSYFLPLARLFFGFFQAVTWPPPVDDPQQPSSAESERAVAAMSYVAAIALPAIQPLMQRCLPDKKPVADAIVRDDCRHVFALLAGDESTLIYPHIGLRGMVALTEGDPEQAQWLDAQRRYLWLFEQWQSAQLREVKAALESDRPSAAGLNLGYFRTMLDQGERAAAGRFLIEHGIALIPPDDWQPAAKYLGRSQ